MARRETAITGPGSRALIVDLVRAGEPVSRTELAERTGLTQGTISNLVRALIVDGILRETGDTVSTGGKPRTMLEINPRAMYGVGVHLGSGQLTCVVTDSRGGVLGRQMVPDSSGGDVVGLSTVVVQLVRETTDGLGLTHDQLAGVAVVGPGIVDRHNGGFPEHPSLVDSPGFDLAETISAKLRFRVLLANEASAAALGEFWTRKISRQSTFGCLYMDAGIGVGLVIDGALQRGFSSNAGSLVNLRVSGTMSGLSANAGLLGDLATPEALVRAARSAGWRGFDVTDAGTPAQQLFDGLARAALFGDEFAAQLIEWGADLHAQAALVLADLLDLDTLVLAGGGYAIPGPRFVQAVRDALDDRAHARGVHSVQVDLSASPRDSAAVGAAALVLQSVMAPGH